MVARVYWCFSPTEVRAKYAKLSDEKFDVVDITKCTGFHRLMVCVCKAASCPAVLIWTLWGCLKIALGFLQFFRISGYRNISCLEVSRAEGEGDGGGDVVA